MRLSRSTSRHGARAPVDVDALWAVAPVAAFHCDRYGTCLTVNPKWAQLAGLSTEDAVGDGWMRAIHPADRPRLSAEWSTRAKTGKDFDLDFRFLRADGSIVHVHGPVAVIRGDDREVTGFLGVLSDVTDRYEAELTRLADEDGLRTSEAMYRTLATAIPVGIAHRDQAGQLTFVNPALRVILGVAADHPVAQIDFDVLHADDRDRVVSAMRHALATGGSYEEDARFLRPDGEIRHVSLRGSTHIDEHGNFGGYLVTGVDVTVQREAELARRRADEQFRVAFDEAPIGIGMIGMDGLFKRVNQAFTEIVGYEPEEMFVLPPYTIVAPEDKAEAKTRMLELLAVDQETASMEFRLIHKSGRAIWAEARINLIRDEDGVPHQFLMQVQDVTERKDYEQRLKYLAHHDPLTSLINRRGLERELDLQIARVRRYGRGGSLLMLDLDGFKSVNDTLGHAVGDALLIGVAGALVERLRETDVVARLGGDEFAVILPAESPAQTRIVASALIQSVAEASKPFKTDRPVTVSIGVVTLDDQTTSEQALRRADHAMYAAKQAGKNRFSMFDGAAAGAEFGRPVAH